MKVVQSSTIQAIGYEPETKILKIQFKSGGTYHYQSIEPHEHESLISATSIGKHFHHNIKLRKRTIKID